MSSNLTPSAILNTDQPRKGTLPAVIRWTRQWGLGSDVIVWVVVRKLHESWKKDDDRLRRGSRNHHAFGDWLRHRYSNEWLANRPHVGYVELNGREFISFTDGRHRFAWCTDHGVKAIPVTVEGRQGGGDCPQAVWINCQSLPDTGSGAEEVTDPQQQPAGSVPPPRSHPIAIPCGNGWTHTRAQL